MPISALPTPPSRQDPTNFNDRADAFLGALPLFQSEANTLQTDVNAKQVQAATSETNAAASAFAAAQTANVSLWVAGTTYAVGDNVFSPNNHLTYRRITAGAGTTDPDSDPTNWRLLTGLGDVSTLNIDQTISGRKYFLLDIGGNITGNADTVTNVTTEQVLTATAVATAGAVGTYMFAGLRENTPFNTPVGTTKAGSALKPGSVYRWTDRTAADNVATNDGRFPVAYLGDSLTGTWRLMGALRAGPLSDATYFIDSVSLWLRIA